MSLLLCVFFATAVSSAEFGSHEYCNELADVGMNAYKAKQEGNSLSDVITLISHILKDDAKKSTAANGVVMAIYGDASISSASEAYSIVYKSCRQ